MAKRGEFFDAACEFLFSKSPAAEWLIATGMLLFLSAVGGWMIPMVLFAAVWWSFGALPFVDEHLFMFYLLSVGVCVLPLSLRHAWLLRRDTKRAKG